MILVAYILKVGISTPRAECCEVEFLRSELAVKNATSQCGQITKPRLHDLNISGSLYS